MTMAKRFGQGSDRLTWFWRIGPSQDKLTGEWMEECEQVLCFDSFYFFRLISSFSLSC